MNEYASRRYIMLWTSVPLMVAVGRIIDWWRLGRGDQWAYYLGEPIPIFWAVILLICALCWKLPVRRGWLRAGVFVWLIVCYGLLPTQAGSMAAHPDYFLEEVVDRINETIHTHRSSGRLPNHAVDLRKILSVDDRLHYRRGETLNVPVDIRIHPQASGPILKAADRPGVIDVALEGPNQRIWVTATGLGFARFNRPVLLKQKPTNEVLVLEHAKHQLPKAPKKTP